MWPIEFEDTSKLSLVSYYPSLLLFPKAFPLLYLCKTSLLVMSGKALAHLVLTGHPLNLNCSICSLWVPALCQLEFMCPPWVSRGSPPSGEQTCSWRGSVLTYRPLASTQEGWWNMVIKKFHREGDIQAYLRTNFPDRGKGFQDKGKKTEHLEGRQQRDTSKMVGRQSKLLSLYRNIKKQAQIVKTNFIRTLEHGWRFSATEQMVNQEKGNFKMIRKLCGIFLAYTLVALKKKTFIFFLTDLFHLIEHPPGSSML